MLGADIGEVSDAPELVQSSSILVPLAIEEAFLIPVGSSFQISSASLLGDKEIVVTPPESGAVTSLAPGAKVMGAGATGLDLLQNEAERIANKTGTLIQQAGTTLEKVDLALVELRTVTSRLGESLEIVNKDVLGSKNLENLSAALAHFNQAAQSIGELAEDFRPTAADSRIAIIEIRKATREARKAIAKIEPALADAPEVLEAFKDTAISIEKTAEEASAAIAKVENGDGALSALTQDPKTKEDTQVFIENLRKYGILGYRDEKTKDDPRERRRGRRR